MPRFTRGRESALFSAISATGAHEKAPVVMTGASSDDPYGPFGRPDILRPNGRIFKAPVIAGFVPAAYPASSLPRS